MGNATRDDNRTIALIVEDSAGNRTPVTLEADSTTHRLLVNATLTAGLVSGTYDYIGLTYTGSNLTGVVYKSGGSGGTTIATLTLAYTGSRLDSVTRT